MVDKEEERKKIIEKYGARKPAAKKPAAPKLSEYKSVAKNPTVKSSGAGDSSMDDKKAAWKEQIANIRKSMGPKTIGTHEMGYDDTLSHVALKYYKNASKPYYEWIWKHNLALLGDSPNNTKPGMKINIPELSKVLDGSYEPKVPKGFLAVHTVVQDDMLSKIAQKYYGNGNKPYYMWIYEANKDLLGDSANNTRPGMELLIPELSEELKG